VDTQTLFKEALDELAKRTLSGTSEYDLVKASALLRLLLLDDQPLMDQVNRTRRLDIRFAVGRTPYTDVVMAAKPIVYARGDGLDPGTGIPSTVAVPLKRDAFLREVVIFYEGHVATVHDVIDYLAHVEGGVHRGIARDGKAKALKAMSEQIALGGYPLGAQSVRAIARVVINALQPLRESVQGTS
jgi:hypothetical protein